MQTVVANGCLHSSWQGRAVSSLPRRWEAAVRLDDFAQPTVQRLDCVGGVDHFSDLRRESEEWDDVLPYQEDGDASGQHGERD